MSRPQSNFPGACQDASSAALRGLRDVFSTRILLVSLALWVGAMALCGLLLFAGWEWARAFSDWATAWTLLGVFVLFPGLLPAGAQSKLSGVPLAEGAQALLGPVFPVASGIFLLLLVLMGVFLAVRVGTELFLMPQVQQHVRRHYPAFPPSETSAPALEPLKRTVKFGALALCALPCLLVPGLNILVGVGFFGYLNVRTLVNDALEGIAPPDEQRAVIRAARSRMVLLGIVLTGAFAIPFVGLIGPAWTAASVCHLCFATLRRLRAA